MKRTLLYSLGIFVSAVAMSGCANPTAELAQSEPIRLSGQNQVQNTPPNSGTNTETERPVVNNSSVVKSLADFPENPATRATLITSKGEIIIELYREQAPLTTANFLALASSNFYDGIVFHRVIPDFMAQVGDPNTKISQNPSDWGFGGPGYVIADEFDSTLTHDKAGVVSMANSGPNSGGSQFFLTFGPTDRLDGKHAIFGQVVEGIDILNSISQGDTIDAIRLE
jgi:cyclophilin family peptidyl-prolyl cis-trans isomerase